MTAPSTSCRDLEPEVVALARGELPPAEAAPLRAHLEGCSSCASLHADTLRVRAAAAARPAPVPGEASRARLRAVLDAAWEESLAEEEAEADRRRSRGPVLRLLDHAGRRYAESRAVRFLTFSVAIHAAAAVALTVHLVGGGGGSGDRRPLIEVSGTFELPPPYPEDPFTAPPVPEGGIAEGTPLPWIPDAGWPVPGSSFPGAEPTPVLQDPLDFSAAQRLYPNGEFSAFATARFRSDLRTRGLARAWGAEEATAVGRAVERSLAFLAGTQESDGTWPSGRPGDPKPQRDRFRGGVTGICVGAFLADGRTALREGTYSSVVRDAVNALAGSQDRRTGLLGAFAAGPANDRPLVNHGPALGALAEAYGLDWRFLREETRRDLAAVILRGIAASLAAQREDGSFGYAPGARSGDASVTLLQIEALEAARLAGFEVGRAALDRAAAWIASRIGPDGRLGYRVAGDRGADATLTAEALTLDRVLRLPPEVRDRMLAEVLREAAAADLGDRVLFRSAVLETLAPRDAAEPGNPAGAVVRATLRSQSPSGAFGTRKDTWSLAAGDALGTARTVRALTAPWR